MIKILEFNKWILLAILVILPIILKFYVVPINFYLDISVTIFTVFILTIWYYSIESLLSFKYGLMNNSLIVKPTYLYFLIYPIFFQIFFFPATEINSSNPLFYYILPFHILWIIALIMIIKRISKGLKEKLKISDTFFMLLFFPIGIFLLQPKFNAIMNSNKN